MNDTARNLCDFLDASPSPYQAVENMAAYLMAKGSTELFEKDPWHLEPGASYFIRRGGTALIAFKPGFHPLGSAGFLLAGAHTDSPSLKVRSGAELLDRSMLRLAVEPYGSAVLSSWVDKPLSLAGQVILRGEKGYTPRLYDSVRPIGVIPGLAIHLDRELNRGMEFKAHQHLPVFVDIPDSATALDSQGSWLASRLAEELAVPIESIAGMDLSFYDSQKAVIFGSGLASNPRTYAGTLESAPVQESMAAQLINAGRLDNLAGCKAILYAFCAAKPGVSTQIACFMDAEEIGSRAPGGADSSFLRDLIARINIALKGNAEDFYRAVSSSLCISLDAAQAWNPAYAEKYDPRYSPRLGFGPALKLNASKRYATDSLTEAIFSRLCEEQGVQWQKYMARADSQPGSTIGPITAARLGIRCMDIGHPLLSMHASRETIDASDHGAVCNLLKGFFQQDTSSLGLF